MNTKSTLALTGVLLVLLSTLPATAQPTTAPASAPAQTAAPAGQNNITELVPLLPGKETFIATAGGDKTQGVRFLFEAETPWVSSLSTVLAEAAMKARNEVYGFKLPIITVCVFNDRKRCNALLQAYAGRTFEPHEWIVGVRGVLVACPMSATGQLVAPINAASNYFRSTIAHQYSHCLNQIMSGAVPLPFWLDEGLAMTVAGKLVPENVKLNDYVAKSLFVRDAVVPLEQLSAIPSTHGTQLDEGRTDAQQQSFHMVRVLLEQSQPEGLGTFLSMPRTDDVEAAFATAFAMDLMTFHTSWKSIAKKAMQ
jgi:hypothetical protein